MLRLLSYWFSHLHVLSYNEYGEGCRVSSEFPGSVCNYCWSTTLCCCKIIPVVLARNPMAKTMPLWWWAYRDEPPEVGCRRIAGSHVTRTGYAHQVRAAVLYIVHFNSTWHICLMEIMLFNFENGVTCHGWASSIKVLGTDVVARTYGDIICEINSKE